MGASLLAGSSLAAIPRLLGASPAPDPRALEMFADIPGVKELMNAETTNIDDSGINFIDGAIKDLTQNVIVSPLHSDRSVEQLRCKSSITKIKIRCR